MGRLAYALAGISIAVVAVAPALADSASSTLSVTVTVVPPGTLGGTNLPAGPEDKTRQPAADAPAPDAPRPRPGAVPPAQ